MHLYIPWRVIYYTFALYSKICIHTICLKYTVLFLKIGFLLHLKNHHLKDTNLKFGWNSQAIWMYEAILCLAAA